MEKKHQCRNYKFFINKIQPQVFWACICCDVHFYIHGLVVWGWLGVTGVLVTGLFIGYLPSDWLEDRPQVQ